MFKVKNLIDKKEIDTEFWLEEEYDGCVLLKVKLKDAKEYSVIANINKEGICLWSGIRNDLGFKTVKRNEDDLVYINAYLSDKSVLII